MKLTDRQLLEKVIKELQNEKKKLNPIQASGVFFYRAVSYPFMTPKLSEKLRKQPLQFFNDSKNSFTKAVGNVLGLTSLPHKFSSLSPMQRWGIKIFTLAATPFMLEKYQKQLKESPLEYFDNAKDERARAIAKFLSLPAPRLTSTLHTINPKKTHSQSKITSPLFENKLTIKSRIDEMLEINVDSKQYFVLQGCKYLNSNDYIELHPNNYDEVLLQKKAINTLILDFNCTHKNSLWKGVLTLDNYHITKTFISLIKFCITKNLNIWLVYPEDNVEHIFIEQIAPLCTRRLTKNILSQELNINYE